MNTIQQGIITLLKCAVTGEQGTLPPEFRLEEALPQIRRHHMATLAYEGTLHCGISPQHPVMQKLFQSYCKAYLVSEGQMKAFERICAAFDENGIDYMPLKGTLMKSRYPKPELRMMGDADILIRLDQYERIVPIMEGLGFARGHESDHELVWKSDQLYVELHKRVIPSYNKDFHRYFGTDSGWQLAKVNEGTRYAMTAEDELIYLFTHFAKHYRDGGIGCRHVLDLWVFLRTFPEVNQAAVRAELETLRLLEFYENILRLLDVWFGRGEMDGKTEYMTEYVFASGSWGQMESRILSQTVRNSKNSMLRFSGRLVYIWETLFPGVDVLKEKYTILQKAPWALPLVWLVRPFYKVLFERKDLKRQERNLSALDRDSVKQRQQLLNYVGLDYHF